MKPLSVKAKQVKESSTLAITAKAKQMKAQGIDIVSFGAGEPDFNTPDFIIEAAYQAMKSGFTKYTPAAGIVELKQAICNKLQRDNGLLYEPSQIVVSNGAKHSLTNIFIALLEEGEEVIIPSPYWLSYKQIIEIAGGVAVLVDTNFETDYKITVDQLEKALTNKTKAVIINSPNNPTGSVYSREELQLIADFAVKNDIYVVADEIYEYLVYDEGIDHVSIASLGKEIYDRTIVVNGLSKSHAMPGWRIGFAASNKEIAGVMANIQSHQASNPNSIAQKGALAAYSTDLTCVDAMKVEYKKRRDYVYDRCAKVPFFKQHKPLGAFYVFIDITEILGKTYKNETIKDAADFSKYLLEDSQVSVIPCLDFGFANCIRISYATSLTEIEKGMNRIEAFVTKNFK